MASEKRTPSHGRSGEKTEAQRRAEQVVEPDAEMNWYWPAEWEPHDATWISWPTNRETWPSQLPRVEQRFAEIVRCLREGEEVWILTDSPGEAERIRSGFDLGGGHEVRFLDVPTNDAWVRDYGPIVLVDGQGRRGAVLSRFDSWGGKYPPWEADARVGELLADDALLLSTHTGLVLEGGSIETDGQGCLLTTESCLLDAGRNPGVKRRDLERTLCRHLHCDRVIWLGDGIAGDDTDGHVDDLTRFVDEGIVVTARESDADDINWEPLERNRERLLAEQRAGNLSGVIDLPMPRPVFHDGLRCPASYANFYVGNAVVLVPSFDDPADEVALEVIGEYFPGRRRVGIDCRDIISGLGALHCLTQPLFSSNYCPYGPWPEEDPGGPS